MPKEIIEGFAYLKSSGGNCDLDYYLEKEMQ
jgi:hypothetical protein